MSEDWRNSDKIRKYHEDKEKQLAAISQSIYGLNSDAAVNQCAREYINSGVTITPEWWVDKKRLALGGCRASRHSHARLKRAIARHRLPWWSRYLPRSVDR